MGFPLDLTELMAREVGPNLEVDHNPNPSPNSNPNPKQVGLEVDTAGFQAAMEEQKARSAAAAAASKAHGSG